MTRQAMIEEMEEREEKEEKEKVLNSNEVKLFTFTVNYRLEVWSEFQLPSLVFLSSFLQNVLLACNKLFWTSHA